LLIFFRPFRVRSFRARLRIRSAFSSPPFSSPNAKSCDELQNQTFKDHRSFSPASGQQKTQSDADAKFYAFSKWGFTARALVHCRDKIEFNLKSQKLEEPVLPFWRQTHRLWRDGNPSGSLSAVNGNFEFSSTFSLSADSKSAAVFIPFGGGARKLSNTRKAASAFFKKVCGS
jgi:hypothetical protein